MLISEVIEQLEKIKREHDNIFVTFDGGGAGEMLVTEIIYKDDSTDFWDTYPHYLNNDERVYLKH